MAYEGVCPVKMPSKKGQWVKQGESVPIPEKVKKTVGMIMNVGYDAVREHQEAALDKIIRDCTWVSEDVWGNND